MFITVCALVLPINIELSRISKDFLKFSGDRTERVTPVPIPNTEVKPLRADGTARATAWETRSLPGLKRLRGAARLVGVFFVLYLQTLTTRAIARPPLAAAERR